MSAFIAIFTASCSVPTSDSRLISTPLNEPQSPIHQQIKNKNISSTFIYKDQVLKQKAIQDKILQKKLHPLAKGFSIKSNPNALVAGILTEGDTTTTTFSGVPKKYRFYATAWQNYRLKLSELDAKDAFLTVTSPDGSVSYTNDDTFGLDSYIQFTPVQSGFWTVEASTYEGNANQSAIGAFELSLNADTGASHPSVAQAADGSFVITWQEYNRIANGGWDIFARKFDSYGSALTPVFQVNDTYIGQQMHPRVAIKDNGYFTITWDGNGSGDSTGVYIKRYTNTLDSSNLPIPRESELRMNYNTNGNQANPDIAMGQDGSCVVTWQTLGSTDSTDGIFLGRMGYLSLGPEEKVNTSTGNYRSNPKIAINQNEASTSTYGNFVVIWQGDGSGDTEGIYNRGYNMFNTSFSSLENRVNYNTTGYQGNPDVSMASDGKYVTAWQSNELTYPYEYSIFTKVTGADFNDITHYDIAVNGKGSYYNSNPSVSVNQKAGKHHGDFVVNWQGFGNDSLSTDNNIVDSVVTESNQRRFNVEQAIINNVYIDYEYRDNSYTNGVQSTPDVSLNMDSTGDYNLSNTDINYSRGAKTWSTRGSSDNSDGIKMHLIRNNSYAAYGLLYDVKIN